MEALQLTEEKLQSASSVIHGSGGFSPRFVIQGKLKEGGTSTLLLAGDTFLEDTLVVLKCINNQLFKADETRDIATRELTIAKQLSHPNLIKIFDIRRNRSSDYLVMEYLEGNSLKELLSRNRLDLKSAEAILEPLVDVLGYMHQEGIVHSDLKPSNIMLTRDNGIKLIDLANCRQESQAKTPSITIKTNHFFGYSLDYSSPQVINDEPATASDDVFSLACVFYEMLEGGSPIHATKQPANQSALSVKKPSQLNYFQWLVLKRAMSLKSKKRFQTVDDFWRQYLFAKKIYRFSVLMVVLICMLAFAGLKAWGVLESYNQQATRNQTLSNQQNEISKVKKTIMAELPLARYKQLKALDAFPNSLRNATLAALFDDVSRPVVEHVQQSLLSQDGVPDFEGLTNKVDELRLAYPDSLALHQLSVLLVKEKGLLADGLIIQLGELVNGGQYSDEVLADAGELVEKLNQLGVSQLNIALGENYQDNYSQYVRSVIAAKDWIGFKDAHRFAKVNAKAMPELNQVWGQVDKNLVLHAYSIATYLSDGVYTLEAFPTAAANYFIKDKLLALSNATHQLWYNKDIEKQAKQLLALKNQYQIPNEYPIYHSSVERLNEKIAAKMVFHKKNNQLNAIAKLEKIAQYLKV
jgi:serine/threonine protein kinase